MQTISEIHDISETGAEWVELNEAMEEFNKERAREKRVSRQASIFSRMVAKFKRERGQLKLL